MREVACQNGQQKFPNGDIGDTGIGDIRKIMTAAVGEMGRVNRRPCDTELAGPVAQRDSAQGEKSFQKIPVVAIRTDDGGGGSVVSPLRRPLF
jgi:hypothetical protein